MENLNLALGLLVVGMVTVLIILSLVVVIGNLVIMLTNRFITVSDNNADGKSAGKKAHSKKLAAIVAAVDVVTKGKGKVDSIEKK